MNVLTAIFSTSIPLLLLSSCNAIPVKKYPIFPARIDKLAVVSIEEKEYVEPLMVPLGMRGGDTIAFDYPAYDPSVSIERSVTKSLLSQGFKKSMIPSFFQLLAKNEDAPSFSFGQDGKGKDFWEKGGSQIHVEYTAEKPIVYCAFARAFGSENFKMTGEFVYQNEKAEEETLPFVLSYPVISSVGFETVVKDTIQEMGDLISNSCYINGRTE